MINIFADVFRVATRIEKRKDRWNKLPQDIASRKEAEEAARDDIRRLRDIGRL